MGHAGPLDDVDRQRRRRAGHTGHPGPSEEPRLPDLLARPGLRPVRRQPARPEGFHQWQGVGEFRPCAAGGRDIPLPHPDPVRRRDTRADRDDLPGLHPVSQAAQAVRIHPADNVVVAVRPLAAGCEFTIDGEPIVLRENVAAGHKIALRALEPGESVVKYGFPIGEGTALITPGAWVHSHNLKTCLEGTVEDSYEPATPLGLPSRQNDTAAAGAPDDLPAKATFAGYRRRNGRVGTRNEVWILNTVGCVNHAAERIAQLATERFAGQIDGAYAFSHPYGCSQLGDDLGNTRRVLAGLMRHPNAGGVLVLGLGCESNQMDGLLGLAGDLAAERLRFFNSLAVPAELAPGLEHVAALVARMESDAREPCPASDLVLGHKCGGSDGFSGITANSLLRR